MEEQKAIIAVIPVNPEDRLAEYRDTKYNVSPFHVKHKCERCEVVCWIGPKQLTMKNTKPETLIICSNCLIQLSNQNGVNLISNVQALGK